MSDLYIKTAQSSYISRTANLLAPTVLQVGASCIIHDGATIHGPNVTKIASHVTLGNNVNLVGSSSVGSSSIQSSIGSHTIIHSGTTSRAASIGSSCVIGANCTLGESAIIEDGVYLLPDSSVPENAFFPTRAVVGGRPARIIDIMADGVEDERREMLEDMYKDFVYELNNTA